MPTKSSYWSKILQTLRTFKSELARSFYSMIFMTWAPPLQWALKLDNNSFIGSVMQGTIKRLVGICKYWDIVILRD